MITKRKLKAEVVRLTYRVEELEERLCPCNQHDYVKVGTEWDDMPAGSDMIGRYKFKEDAVKARLSKEIELFGEYAPQKALYETYQGRRSV